MFDQGENVHPRYICAKLPMYKGANETVGLDI